VGRFPDLGLRFEGVVIVTDAVIGLDVGECDADEGML